jgi:hypothetical protein
LKRAPGRPVAAEKRFKTRDLASVAGGCSTSRYFDGLRQSSAHWSESESRHLALWGNGNAGSFSREFVAAVQMQPRFFQELSRKTHILGTVHTPKPQFLLLTLEEIQSVFQPLHRTIKGGSEKVDAQRPSMARVVDLDTDTVFPRLIAVDGATVVIANRRSASCHVGVTDLWIAGAEWP